MKALPGSFTISIPEQKTEGFFLKNGYLFSV